MPHFRRVLFPLTALRFLFAMMVFAAHCVIFIPGGEAAHPTIYGIVHEGFIGVSFFFVLSGFILAHRYADALKGEKIGLKTFWVRRFARIYPVYLFCLLFSAVLHFKYLQTEPISYFRDFSLHLSMLQIIVAGGRHGFVFNGAAWSVADEMVFYLLFPLLIVLARRQALWLSVLLLGCALVVAGLLLTPEPTFYMFYRHPLVRLVDFALGIGLYQLYQRDTRPWNRARGTATELAAIALLAAFMLLRNQVPEAWHYSAYYWIPTLFLIYTFAKGSGRISGWLSRPLPVLLGEASYSFYLFHIPAAIFLSIAFRRLGLAPSPLLQVACYFVFSLAASLLLFRYLERPANAFLRRRLLRGRQDA